jgi:hypothetical protein
LRRAAAKLTEADPIRRRVWMQQPVTEEGRRFLAKLLAKLPEVTGKPEPKPEPRVKVASTAELSVEIERERAQRELERLRAAERREVERLRRAAQEEANRNLRQFGSRMAPTAKELFFRQQQAAMDNLYEMKLEMEKIKQEFEEADIMHLWSAPEPFHGR